jgi:MFS family permease
MPGEAVTDAAARDKKHIVVFALITGLCLMGDSMLYIALPLHYAELGLDSLWEVGIVLAVNRLARLPLNPCIGRLYSRVSERAGIGIAVALGALTTLSYGFLPDLFWWIAARCLWGLAWSLLRIGSLFCILKISTPRTRGSYSGLYNGLYRLGSLVGMLGGGLLADMLGFRTCAVIFGLATACALPLLPLIPAAGRANAPEQADPADGFRLAARNRETLLTVLCGAVVALVIQGALASTLSRLVSAHISGAWAWGGALLGAGSLAGFFQALRWAWEPWLAPAVGKSADKRFGWRKMLLFVFWAAGLAFILPALPLPLPLWIAGILGMQVASTALSTLVDAGAADVAARAGEGGRSLLMAYALLADVGAAVGPVIAYSLNALWGIDLVYGLCGLCFWGLALVWRRFAAPDIRA